MIPVDRWVIHYADGSTFSSEQGTWAEAPPFGVICVVYYRVDGSTAFQEVGNDEGVVTYLGVPEGCTEPVKMPLWTDGESYWRVHDAAQGTFSP